MQRKLKLFFTLALCWSSGVFAASKQVIVQSHMTSLKITEIERMAPPYAAFMWAMANDAGYKSLKGSQYPELSYQAAFTRVLSLIKPNQKDLAEKWLSLLDLNSSELRAVEAAQAVAEQIYEEHEAHLKEGESPLPTPLPTNPTPGLWRPTPPQFASPALPNWGKLELFSEASLDDLISDLKPTVLDSAQYQEELKEVWRLGGKDSTARTKDQTEIARFWVGGAGTVTPPGLWIHIALQRLQQVPIHFRDSVEVMRVLSFALCDAGIAAWKIKYQEKTWRPISAIHEELKDSSWQPLLTTPPFPSYVSGHSTFSAAAAAVLGVILPLEDKPLTITSPDLPEVTRSYKSYRQAANEAGMSRIYGGIHYQVDNIDGLKLGRRIGCALLDKMYNYSCQ